MSENARPDNPSAAPPSAVHYVQYDTAKEAEYLPAIRTLISKDLSEPYSIYVYRYFLYEWPDLCFMALDDNEAVIGTIMCKLEIHRGGPLRGYIAMLAVREEHRGKGIATRLVKTAIEAMKAKDADEIALETEVTNIPSLRIYENLGFLRFKRLQRYYLNGNTAFRLLLYLKTGVAAKSTYPAEQPESFPNSAGREASGARSVGTGNTDEHLNEAKAREDDALDYL